MAAQGPSPRLRVAAVLPLDAGIVLVRQARNGVAYHLLPGGGVQAGESIDSALRREVLEETGLQCRIVAPLFISDSIDPQGGRHMVQLTFLAAPVGDTEIVEVPADPAVRGVEVVDPRDLVTLDLRPPMADALYEASLSGFNAPARYLGALWVPETGTSTNAYPPASD